jgi:ATP-binding cassette subfamily C exporter for protease/lipase
MELPKPQGKLAVEGVTAAPPGVPVAGRQGRVVRASKPGDVLGVIGPSGSGKSTLARLLVGVWPAMMGKVRLDGADIYPGTRPNWARTSATCRRTSNCSAAHQPRTSPASARSIGKSGAGGQARRRARHDPAFPEGYDTKLGDGGAGLSGGQKQRLGLARAMYGDPALIVLDEPNSNLDDVGEQALVQAVLDLRQRGKTIVLITHRTSVIGATTKLLVMRDGAVCRCSARPSRCWRPCRKQTRRRCWRCNSSSPAAATAQQAQRRQQAAQQAMPRSAAASQQRRAAAADASVTTGEGK